MKKKKNKTNKNNKKPNNNNKKQQHQQNQNMMMIISTMMIMMMMMPRVRRPRGLEISGDRSVSCRRLRLHVVVSGEQITIRSTWVSNRGESPPQTKVTLKQLFDPPSKGGAQGVRPASGRRLGPQVAMSERQRVEAEGGGRRKEEERRHTLKAEPSHGGRNSLSPNIGAIRAAAAAHRAITHSCTSRDA